MTTELAPPRVVAPAARGAALVVKRIRFAKEPPLGAGILCEFPAPWHCVAIEQPMASAAVAVDAESSGAPDELIVGLLPSDAAAEAARLQEAWMDGPNAAQARLTIGGGDQKIVWRPGRAILQGPPASLRRNLEALAGFAFYEGELRRLERAIEDCAAQAEGDVALAHRIRFRDRREWQRLVGLSEHCSRLRLMHVRLAPLLAASHRLPSRGRQVMARLLEQADVTARLEAVSNRLEAYEELYQGAVDRIAEYRWYIDGHWLEAAIILLLLLELTVMLTDLVARHAH